MLPAETIDLDDKLRRALENILDHTLSEKAWTQASLPVYFGGLGIRRATDLALPGFLASTHACRESVRNITKTAVSFKADALRIWDAHQSGRPSEDQVNRQKGWDQIACKASHLTLLSACGSDVDSIRLKAVASESAGAWLEAFPSEQMATQLSNNEFRTACSLRLGLPLFEREACACGGTIDELGLHKLSCSNLANLTQSRHDAVNDVQLHFTSRVTLYPACLQTSWIQSDP
jgi:hypothetical protein